MRGQVESGAVQTRGYESWASSGRDIICDTLPKIPGKVSEGSLGNYSACSRDSRKQLVISFDTQMTKCFNLPGNQSHSRPPQWFHVGSDDA